MFKLLTIILIAYMIIQPNFLLCTDAYYTQIIRNIITNGYSPINISPYYTSRAKPYAGYRTNYYAKYNTKYYSKYAQRQGRRYRY